MGFSTNLLNEKKSNLQFSFCCQNGSNMVVFGLKLSKFWGKYQYFFLSVFYYALFLNVMLGPFTWPMFQINFLYISHLALRVNTGKTFSALFSAKIVSKRYRKDTEPLHHSFMYSFITSFQCLSITCNAFIACYIRCKKYVNITFVCL